MKAKAITGILLATSILTTSLVAFSPSKAKAWVPTLSCSIDTNGGKDVTLPSTGGTVKHEWSWRGSYTSFSGKFNSNIPGYNRTYSGVSYTSDYLSVPYTSANRGATKATLDISTSKESSYDYLYVYVSN